MLGAIAVWMNTVLNFEALHAIYITTGDRPTATSVIPVQIKQGHQFQNGLHFLCFSRK